ncbi:MAG: MBL fold metallo-hydrolase [Gammaproteobacteria bacterium]|nr:MBL fold metallo-hydrolase [Gammaproteobacteria bacterium]
MFLLISIFFASISNIYAADNDKFKDVVIKTIEVRDGIYMLMGAGGNIGVSVGEDGVFLIDDQFAPLTEKITAAVAKLSDLPIKFLINTHWHGDHTGGNENLGKENVLIVAHDNVHARMSVDTLNAFGSTTPASPKAALPVITFNDTVTFRLNGHEIRAFHQSNAHTDGDSIIQFKEANVLHMGDIFFNGFYPFIDTSSEGSINGVIRTVEHILDMVDDETKIIPGHGQLADKKALKKYLEIMTIIRSRMQKLIDEGKSVDEIVAMKPYADYDEKLGGGFMKPERFMRIVYDSLTR